MNAEKAISIASDHLRALAGQVLDILVMVKPQTLKSTQRRIKTISKLSPILGNEIEFEATDSLNEIKEFAQLGQWIRQDPDFPDTLFTGNVPVGFEIKAWFPLATEIAARFRESKNRFDRDHIYMAVLAWVPEYLLYGQPYILDVCIVSGKSVADARDSHYHNPPDYLVMEPEDTTTRTRNLQQTNTNGYKFQGTDEQFREANKIVTSWGIEKKYDPSRKYQERLRMELFSKFPYRLDTNFAKIDRIKHPDIEHFKNRTLNKSIQGKTVKDWITLFAGGNDTEIMREIEECLDIRIR